MKDYKILWRYLQFIAKAKNKHDVHSPFVFKLLTEIIENKSHHQDYDKIKANHHTLNKWTRLLEVSDLGSKSGEKTFVSYTASIAELNKARSIQLKNQYLLYRLVKFLSPKHILELGTSFGSSALCMSLAAPESKIYSIEGCANVTEVALENLENGGIQNVEIYNGSFKREIPSILNKLSTLDLVFIDGDHRNSSTYQYFSTLVDVIHEDSCFIIDDIHWSAEMEECWSKICAHPQVSISIDLFNFGVIFFRKGIPKQDFILKASY